MMDEQFIILSNAMRDVVARVDKLEKKVDKLLGKEADE